MKRRERLLATMRGEPVDRPAVSFYEIGGFEINSRDPDPFNVYGDPSWGPLLELAESETDLIRMCGPVCRASSRRADYFTVEQSTQNGSRLVRTTLRVGGRTMTSLERRDPDVNTVWHIEHLLKGSEDLEAYLELPDDVFEEQVSIDELVAAETLLGDRGIVMVDTPDPLCVAAGLFSMQDYLAVAFCEPVLFHRLLEKVAKPLQARTEQVAREFPGHLWRIVGAEYAAEPFLPPRLFAEYVVRYTQPMVDAVRRGGGWVRLHCHGRIRRVLDQMVAMGIAGIDPIEPPPQGDVVLGDVRSAYGADLVLFGNIEINAIETMQPAEFEPLVAQAVREGTSGSGRGFVLMPTAAPYGRTVTNTALANYQAMVRAVQ